MYRLRGERAGTRCFFRHLSDLFQPLICIHLKALIPAETDLKKLVCATPTASHCKWGCTFIIVIKPFSSVFFLAFFYFLPVCRGCRDKSFVYAMQIRENKCRCEINFIFFVSYFLFVISESYQWGVLQLAAALRCLHSDQVMTRFPPCVAENITLWGLYSTQKHWREFFASKESIIYSTTRPERFLPCLYHNHFQQIKKKSPIY